MMEWREIEKEVYRRFPKTDGERHCKREKDEMNEIRQLYREKLERHGEAAIKNAELNKQLIEKIQAHRQKHQHPVKMDHH